mgnify:CR=1 FL=1
MKDINFGAFESLYDFYTAFPNEETCIAYLEMVLWPNGVVSPYDVSGKNFNVRIGTIFENTKIPLRKWSLAMYFVANHRKGISATQLSSDIGVTLKTAWFLLQKVRRTLHRGVHRIKLDGEVELDETFVGGKNKNRHANKKAKKCQGRAFVDKVPVMGMLERDGNVVCKVVNDTSVRSLTPPILRYVKRTATLYTDEWC